MQIPNKYYLKAIGYGFKNREGEPFLLTPGQSDIFRLIYEPSILRAAIKTITQYGKSDTASIALICTLIDRKEKVLIVAPSTKQADIIMRNIIDHLFDDTYLTAMISGSGSAIEKLKIERSKTRITFRNGSEVFILTADAETVSKEGKNLMGFGATIILIDESSLIPDIIYTKILRMAGGTQGKIIQLGNPFEDNHFGRCFRNRRYQTVSINWQQALAEGRITQDFLDEAREEMTELEWTIFYETEFPKGGAIDGLIPPEWIELAVEQEGVGGEMKQAGLDVARFGRDRSVYALRIGGRLLPLKVMQGMDTMALVGWVSIQLIEDRPEILGVDVIGIGAGVYDRLDEVKEDLADGYEIYIVPVNVGESPSSEENKRKYSNLRAEIYWHLREQFRPEDGKSKISIPNDPELKKELSEIRYKIGSERTIKIEDKEDMKKRLGRSPDKADAVALCFADLQSDKPDMIFLSV